MSALRKIQDAHAATYSYVANSTLINQINFTQSGGTRMTASPQYDKLNRMQTNSVLASSGATVRFTYQYNNANQRTNVALEDGSYWAYTYDTLGQLTTGSKRWADGSQVSGQYFEYAHSFIGNRTLTKAGGDQSGAGLRPASYTANSVNQYTSRQVPSAVDVLGLANADPNLTNVTVSINGTNQTVYRHNDYFQAAGSVSNNGQAAWAPVSATVSRSTNSVQQPTNPPGHILVPPATQAFQYDADGNLTNDLVWSYTWDGENRLIAMDCLVSGPVAQHLSFDYDWQGRRVRKVARNTNGTILTDTRYVYDGWNLVAETTSGNQLVRTYLWGADLSGTWQGSGSPRQSGVTAGGIGGLLAINDATNGTHFVAYDGNGNVAALVRAIDGSVSARYEYGPFGELIRATGPMAHINPFRWSTKYWDEETDLAYYGYRYYSPSLGRWLSRDPIGEEGGNNLYGFVGNNPVNLFDALGLVQTGGPLATTIPPSEQPPIHPCTLWLGTKEGRESATVNLLGATICYNGVKYACAYPDKIPQSSAKIPTARQIITLCVQAHEVAHFPETEACRTDCNGLAYRVDNKSGVKEMNAYKAELRCLANYIGRCGDDENCKLEVRGWGNNLARLLQVMGVRNAFTDWDSNFKR